ncbi:MAG: 2'-5' RNA ligase [Proteobacteria bacterium]|nr:2'-5' RNA ligase [Pseudomonadota bacterium]
MSHRLFFALRPSPAAVRAALAVAVAQRAAHGLTGRLIAPEKLHVSLNPVGGSGPPDSQTVARACEAASGLRMGSFVAAFDRVVSFGQTAKSSPLVLCGEDGVLGVTNLFGGLHTALSGVGLARGPEPQFVPHMTLLYDPRRVSEAFIDPVSWRVREVVLIHSDRTEGRHRLLGRWPLA